MKRRNFVTTLLAGAAALPFVGRATAKTNKSPQPPMTVTTTKDADDDCTCSLQHRESYSGNRVVDARIISDVCSVHGPHGRV